MEEHVCELSHKEYPVMNMFIDAGLCIQFRRNFRMSIMLSMKHPFTEMYFKSMRIRNTEQIRHMSTYPNTIHPFSVLQVYWECFISLVYMFTFGFQAYKASFSYQISMFRLFSYNAAAEVILFLDMMKMFITGYYDIETNKSVLRMNLIAKNYLKTYFIIDFLPCVQVVLYPFINYFDISSLSKPIHLFRFFLALRIFRVPRILSAVEVVRSHSRLSMLTGSILKTLVFIALLLAWLYFLEFTIENVIEHFVFNTSKWEDVTWDRYYSSTLKLMLISFGDFYEDMYHIVFVANAIIFMFVGFVLHLFLLAQVLRNYNRFLKCNTTNNRLYMEFKHYVSYKALPPKTRKRFFAFFEFKFKNRYFRENEINRSVSVNLQQEIKMYITKPYMERVECFKDLPYHIMLRLVNQLRSEIYLNGDTIMSAGTAGNCMYFIYYGTVAVYSPSGSKICNLEDGSHFGEVALIVNEPRVATVVAVTPCELFVLHRNDFLEVLAPYPDVKENIFMLAFSRMVISRPIGPSSSRQRGSKIGQPIYKTEDPWLF